MTATLSGFEYANASYVTDRLLVGGDLDTRDSDKVCRQLGELIDAGVTHVVDCRSEADDSDLFAQVAEVAYLHHGIHDAGQRLADSWFDTGVGYALEALQEPGTVLLTHCHMGINRGPSLGYAVLLSLGWDPIDAIDRIRTVRPIANVWYAEDALGWHHRRTQATADTVRQDRARLVRWRQQHPLDVVRIIATVRNAERRRTSTISKPSSLHPSNKENHMTLSQNFDYLRLGPSARHLLQSAFARAADRGLTPIDGQTAHYVSLSPAAGHQVAVYVDSRGISIALNPETARSAAEDSAYMELETNRPTNERTRYVRATWDQMIRHRGSQQVGLLIDAALDRSLDFGPRA